MKTQTALCGLISGLLAIVGLTCTTQAAVIEIGDVNFISDGGNASDGIGFLDLSYSNGKTSAQALIDAQAVYAGARLAFASEFDDLFAAAGIVYDGPLAATASGAFDLGVGGVISNASVAAHTLSQQLGFTFSDAAENETRIWSDPDGVTNGGTTLDYIVIDAPASGPGSTMSTVTLVNFAASPPLAGQAWLIVAPEPSRALLSLVGVAAIGLRRRR